MLRVNAPMSFGILHLAPAIAVFMKRYPDLEIDLTLNDRFVDLIDEGYDLAIRIGTMADSSLIGPQAGAQPARLMRGTGLSAPAWPAGGAAGLGQARMPSLTASRPAAISGSSPMRKAHRTRSG